MSCAICNATFPTVTSFGGTGYATLVTGLRVCYPCAESMEREAFAKGNPYTCYLASDGKSVTTWTGGELAKVTTERTIRAGFGGRMTYVRAKDATGHEWYGRNAGRGMCLTLRRASR